MKQQQHIEPKKPIMPKKKPVSQRKNTPSDSAPNPDSHVKTDRANKPEIDTDLSNDDWKDNPGYQPERELPNELYNETLPPDNRVVS